MAESYSPQEQALIERLQNAPQSIISPARFDAIHAQILQAMDAPPIPAPRTGLSLTTPVIAAIVVIIVIVIVVVSGIFSPPAPIVAPTLTPAPSSTPLHTNTPLPSETSVPTFTPAPTLEATLEIVPEITVEATIEPTVEITSEVTPESTAIITPETTPEITPEATQDVVIVIEGPVESITDNLIVIFGITVQIDPSDPLIHVIQVGDVIHIDGTTGNGGIIIAVTVTYVNVDVTVNPTSGEVWRDDGACSHPPPDWAPANGWRRRCQGQTQNSGNGNNGNGNGMGMGNGDD